MFKKKMEKLNIPTHIAFIMDGNRRWAVQRGLPKSVGHKYGAIALKNIINDINEIDGIKYVSVFGFSTENWKRDKKEIDYLFEVCYDMIRDYEKDFLEKNIKFVAMGEIERFPDKLKGVIVDVEEKTKNNTGLVVNLALSYGGRSDIVHAVKQAIANGEEISEETISKNLYSASAPDIDLLVRTSGEMRVSNFMLYQMAYSEFYFPKVHWPSFDKKQLYKALKAYTKRNRRFGGQ